MPRVISYRVAFLTIVAWLGQSRPAAAQLLSVWGHPVFTVGATPYDSVNQGHGNYPGSQGFIPGYGYYPGPGPGHYPWLDGPGVPFDRRKLLHLAPGADLVEGAGLASEVAPAGAALVIVKIPAEADLRINGLVTFQGGSYRRFITPTLNAQANLSYTVRAGWRIQGLELTRIEEIAVAPDGVFTVNFLNTEGWKGRRLEPVEGSELPAPRERVP